jgi:hypothetical protein
MYSSLQRILKKLKVNNAFTDELQNFVSKFAYRYPIFILIFYRISELHKFICHTSPHPVNILALAMKLKMSRCLKS